MSTDSATRRVFASMPRSANHASQRWRLPGPAASENDIRRILDMLIRKRLVIREEDRYLGLPVLTYTPVNQTTQPVRRFVPAAMLGSEHLIHA
jgi:hypothetical protein